MYAVIVTGGKQYKVTSGDIVDIEKTGAKAGEKVTFDKVLLVGGDGDVKVGRPHLEGATVEGEVLIEDRKRKVLVFKKRKRTGYKKIYGHRQPFTRVKIEKINS